MHKIERFIHKHPRYSYGIYILGVLILGGVLFLALINMRLPGTVWLPDRTKYASDDAVIFALPVKSQVVSTSYGAAVRYTTAIDRSLDFKDVSPAATIDEYKPNPRLRASECPNISGITPVSPSDCEKKGTFHGNPIYEIHRRLPSEMAEDFVQVDGTFLYVRGGDSYYVQSFLSFSRHGTGSYLAANNKRAEQVIQKRLNQKAADERASEASYTHLNFTPALATTIPRGWTFDNKRVTIDGPDANHPKLVVTGYYKKEKNGQLGEGVDWFSGNLADFVVMGTCGPSPGDDMAYIPCTKVPGTDRYVAVVRDQYQDYQRFEYQVVGNSLVITSLTVCTCGGKPAQVPSSDLLQAQDTITASAKPVSKDMLKGSKYLRTYYDSPTPGTQ